MSPTRGFRGFSAFSLEEKVCPLDLRVSVDSPDNSASTGVSDISGQTKGDNTEG